MPSAEPNEDCSYEELARIVDANCEPFLTLEQTNRYIKAASMYLRREPSETEQAGDRMVMRGIESGLLQARKAQVVFQISTGRATVIVPTDCLR